MKRSPGVFFAAFALSMPALAADVAIDATYNSYNSGGGDITMTSLAPSDGDGLIVVAAVNGADGSRNVTSVVLDSTTSIVPDLNLIEIGRIDGDDTGANGQNHLLTIWKLDNRAFTEGGSSETLYNRLVIDFASGASATYGFAYILSGQMPDDLIRNWGELAQNNQSSHSITDFVLEPDAMIISAHFWNAGGSRTATVSETEDRNWNNGTTGLAIQHDILDDAADKTMTVSFFGTGGSNADTLNAAVVIRSDDDIIHTPAHTPGTLGDASSGGYWLEGVVAENGSSTAHRGAITDFGVSHTERATWLASSITDGKASFSFRRITHEETPGDQEINIMDFGPLNPDREAVFDMYLGGLEAELAEAIDSDGTHRHLGGGGDDWGDYTGLVIWDLERFCLHYDGAPGAEDTTSWGGEDIYDVSILGVPEWEYNAATRYYWERVHQWFVELYAPSVEALVFYHHPQQPTKIDGLNTDWWDNGYANAGVGWQDEIEWVFKMQGGFDGHCYPMAALTDAQIDDWVTNVLENFRIIDDQLSLYCYVTHWPVRAPLEAYQNSTVVTAVVDADHAIRTRGTNPYTSFNAMYLSGMGLGETWDDLFPIYLIGLYPSVTLSNLTVADKFDPMDPTVDIQGSDTNDGTYDFESVDEFQGNTIVYLDEAPGILTIQMGNYGDLLTPAKTVQNFVDWWEGVFVVVWDAKF